jgi:hypothetical protein
MPSVVERQDETVAAIGGTAVEVEKNALRNRFFSIHTFLCILIRPSVRKKRLVQ